MNVFQQQELLYQQLRQGSGYLKRAQWRDAHTVLNDAQATALELSDVSWFATLNSTMQQRSCLPVLVFI